MSTSEERKIRTERKKEKRKQLDEWNLIQNHIKAKLNCKNESWTSVAKMIDIRFDGNKKDAMLFLTEYYKNNYIKTSWLEFKEKLIQEEKNWVNTITEIKRCDKAKKKNIKPQTKIVRTQQETNKSPSTRSHWQIKGLSDEFIASSEFLQDYRWKQIRMEVLVNQRRKLGFNKCECCNDRDSKLNVDHIKPRKTHPHLALDICNLQILCEDCNHGKGNWCDTDFRTL